MKFVSLLVAGLLAGMITRAQVISGQVFDADTREPIAGAVIEFGARSIWTDQNGHFQLPDTVRSLTCTCVGYESCCMSSDEPFIRIGLRRAPAHLEQVVVTANREASRRSQTPVAIHTISPRIIQETNPTALYEVVNKVPGVMMVNYNNEQHAMSIRQPMGTSNYYLYLEDGIPIRPMGVFNHNALLEINQFTVSSMEVVKGPVSSIYGPEAVGGAVNLIGQRPTVMPTAKLGLQFDHFGYRRVQVGAGAKPGRFGFYTGVLISRQTGSWMAQSDYDKAGVNLRFEYDLGPRSKLTAGFAYANYYSQTAGAVDSIAFYSRSYESTSDFTYRKSLALRNRITMEHRWPEGASSQFTLFHRINRHGQNPAYAIRWVSGQTSARGEMNSNDFESYGFITQHRQPLPFWQGSVMGGAMFDYSPNKHWSHQIDLEARLRPDGLSVEKYQFLRERPEIRLADYSARIKNGALYSQLELEPISRLRIIAGLRYDRMSFDYENFLDGVSGRKSYQQLTPKLGATYRLSPQAGIYANFSRGFAPPALTAIFRKRPQPDPEPFYYNLEAGQFYNYETGGWASLWQNRLFLELSLYQMDGRNELLNIRQPDQSFDYQSAGKTLHRGLEYGLRLKASPQWEFRLGGTTAMHRYEDFHISNRESDAVKNLKGFEMPAAPRTSFHAEWAYYPSWVPDLRAGIEWQHVDGWYLNQVNTTRMEGYDVFHFRIGYSWKGFEWYANVLNLGNRLYAHTATRGNGPNDRTTYTPAAPRTFVWGIQYSFSAKGGKN